MEQSLADLARAYQPIDPYSGVGIPSDAAQGRFNQTLSSLAGGLRNFFATPGDVAAGKYNVKPEVPGQWSEADEFRQQHAQGQLADWGASTAMGMVGGARLPGGAPSGVLGSSGGKLVQPEGIRAYHGSPHDFDRFDLSKIGTGEGAQAYGHGLYFADKEAVALGYRDKLSPKNASDAMAMRLAEKNGRSWSDMGAYERQQYIDEIARNPEIPTLRPGGRMYEVNINAKPEQFLDWDKPLSAQGDVANRIMQLPQVAKQQAAQTAFLGPDKGLTGASAYSAAAKWKRGAELSPSDPAGTTAALREAGIPGIRYLDQGSRTAGTGSSNYVMFDPSLIEIMRKYGLAGVPAAGALAAGGSSDANATSLADLARASTTGLKEYVP